MAMAPGCPWASDLGVAGALPLGATVSPRVRAPTCQLAWTPSPAPWPPPCCRTVRHCAEAGQRGALLGIGRRTAAACCQPTQRPPSIFSPFAAPTTHLFTPPAAPRHPPCAPPTARCPLHPPLALPAAPTFPNQFFSFQQIEFQICPPSHCSYLVERLEDGKQYALKQTSLTDLEEPLRCALRALGRARCGRAGPHAALSPRGVGLDGRGAGLPALVFRARLLVRQSCNRERRRLASLTLWHVPGRLAGSAPHAWTHLLCAALRFAAGG